jgi:ElaB/YqjD/DUF883 family membrane-anchored ribosome-binding protein
MADEIRVTRDNAGTAGTHTHPAQIREHAEVEATIPPDPAPVTAEDPELARAEIEMTRSRMSETIDEIEDRLIEKRERLQDRMDVLAPVRENPLPSVGIALGAGLLFGLLTGGGDDYREDAHEHWEDRSDTWETRARRLLAIAREQEEEIEALSQGRAVPIHEEWDDDEEWDEAEYEEEESPFSGLRDTLEERITGFIGEAVRQMVGRMMPM